MSCGLGVVVRTSWKVTVGRSSNGLGSCGDVSVEKTEGVEAPATWDVSRSLEKKILPTESPVLVAIACERLLI